MGDTEGSRPDLSLLEQPMGSGGLCHWEETDKALQRQRHVKCGDYQEGSLLETGSLLGWGPEDKQRGFGKAETGPGTSVRESDLTHTCSGWQEGDTGTDF